VSGDQIGWAVVELLGHRRLGANVSEVEVAGTKMLRLDIPTDPPVTQFVGGGAIYAITPTSEEIATGVARYNVRPPVNRWELPAGSASAGPRDGDEDDDDPYYEEYDRP
jgi:hypothetical protein